MRCFHLLEIIQFVQATLFVLLNGVFNQLRELAIEGGVFLHLLGCGFLELDRRWRRRGQQGVLSSATAASKAGSSKMFTSGVITLTPSALMWSLSSLRIFCSYSP